MVIATLLWEPNEREHWFSRCYSEEWVEKLYDGFKRNLTKPFVFHCWVDREREFKRPVYQHLIERNPIDYGACIEPYQLNRPMILCGLDTVITGNVDCLADYCLTGDKILLPQDPFTPETVCNGVALVPAGNRRVYDTWMGENDMTWMRSQPHGVIDDHFSGLVKSYKGHVKKSGLGDTRIVYFHGKEKPHELDLPWIKEHWRLNG